MKTKTKPTNHTEPTRCPKCHTSWIGDEIPPNIAHNYSGTHWYRHTGIDGGYIGIYDGLVANRCPDCGEESPVDSSQWALDLFTKYQQYKKGI